MKRLFCPCLVFLFVAGCDGERGNPSSAPVSLAPPSEPWEASADEPTTILTARPPAQTSYQVPIGWSGTILDGELAFFEIAWESPTDWMGPVFASESLFVTSAAGLCCVAPLPEYPDELPDSVYSQPHTFFVRSVSAAGVVDPTPASVSFESHTIAPSAEIVGGPKNLDVTCPSVEFQWHGTDLDGEVLSYRFGLVTLQEWRDDLGIVDTTWIPPSGINGFIAWMDTLTFHPLPGGMQSDDSVWVHTEAAAFQFVELPPTANDAFDLYLFAVRAIDNAGAQETVLNAGVNTRLFNVEPCP